MATRAIIYVRISRDREGGGLGVDRQREDCEHLAKRLGWDIVGLLTDNDMSAYSGKPRPGYVALLKTLRDADADAVLAWHTDRLHRSPVELEDYITLVESRGILTQTVKAGPIDLSTPAGRMNARNLGNYARYEVEHMAERQQRAKLQAASKGEWGGGRRPFGFEKDGVALRGDEAREIISLADGVFAGMSLHALARDLNGRDVLTSTGKPWTPSALRVMLLRARNAGIRVYRGDEVGVAEWPAILPEERWRALAALLRDEGRRTTPGPERRWLGSGLYLCGVCGGRQSMRASTTSAKTATGRRSRPIYTCKAGKHLLRDAPLLDAFVRDILVTRLSRPDAKALLVEQDRPDSADLRSQAIVLRSRLGDIAEAFGAGEMTRTQFKTANERAQGELAAVEGRMAHISRVPILGDLIGAQDVRARWKQYDISRRRAVLDALLVVTLHPPALGRPRNWRPGQPYFDADAVAWEWKDGL